jgi:hypothetical protein
MAKKGSVWPRSTNAKKKPKGKVIYSKRALDIGRLKKLVSITESNIAGLAAAISSELIPWKKVGLQIQLEHKKISRSSTRVKLLRLLAVNGTMLPAKKGLRELHAQIEKETAQIHASKGNLKQLAKRSAMIPANQREI